MLAIGNHFPAYNLIGVYSHNPENAFRELNDSDFSNQWKIYFFWPKDFTFVCPTEIVGFGKLNSAFADRETQLIGVSTDSEFVHLAWRKHHEELTESPFPWLADIKKELSEKLGVLDQQSGVANRATFIVDPNNIIRHVSVNDGKVGRNPNEILRILDALQTDELCPCNWKQGESTITA